MSLLAVISKDNELIPYRKELNSLTGSVTATILLQQMIFRFTNNGNKSFYKFIEPCEHRLYKEGDSWTEELGFTPREFKTAFSKLSDLGLVSKKTNMDRVTFYDLDLEAIGKALNVIYVNAQKATHTAECAVIKSTNAHLDYSRSFDTETTTEITTKKEKINKKDFSFNLSKAFTYEALSEEYKLKLRGYAVIKDGAYQIDKFLDHHISKGTKYKDWSRAYNTWISNAKEYSKGTYNPQDYVSKHTDHPQYGIVFKDCNTDRAYDNSFDHVCNITLRTAEKTNMKVEEVSGDEVPDFMSDFAMRVKS